MLALGHWQDGGQDDLEGLVSTSVTCLVANAGGFAVCQGGLRSVVIYSNSPRW